MGKSKYLALGALAMTASVAAMSVAQASVVITQIGPQNTRTFDNNAVGSTSGTSSTNSGPISFTTAAGAVANGTASTNAAPAGDTSNYLWDVAGATVTFTNGPVHWVDIYWGSIDGSPGSSNNNVLALSIAGDTITGADLAGMGIGVDGSGNQHSAGDNQWFRISDSNGQAFSSFTVSSSTNAFEFDMAAPEASTWAMMVFGFAGLGFAAFYGRRKGDISIVSA